MRTIEDQNHPITEIERNPARACKAIARTSRQQAMAREIALLARQADRDFKDAILPAVARDDRRWWCFISRGGPVSGATRVARSRVLVGDEKENILELFQQKIPGDD